MCPVLKKKPVFLYVYLKLCGKKFRISPQSFFQPNTSATEILYNTINELAPNPGDSSLIDICCGAGTIGLCLSEVEKHFLWLGYGNDKK